MKRIRNLLPRWLTSGASGRHGAAPIEAVREFYDSQTPNFLKVYGDVIQAYRTIDVSVLLDQQMAAMELAAGLQVLDAGCGVCGPALHFARRAGVSVDGVNLSGVQVDLARDRIVRAGMQEQVRVHHGDFHQLAEMFPDRQFDVVCFLESFGHSHDKRRAVEAAWSVLKPGGILYVKDLFVKESPSPELQGAIAGEVARINRAYRYQIGDLYQVLRDLRRCGFILAWLRTIDIPLDQFENLTISNVFQELTGIARIDDWESYVFPVDFFEIKCFKPWYDTRYGARRYFIQNLWWMRLHGKEEADLGTTTSSDSARGPSKLG